MLKKKTTYLGHEIGYILVKLLRDNIVAIKRFPTPKTRKNVMQILGKINFYWEYIPKSRIILEPFYNLLRKNVRFHWSGKCQENFEKLKEYLSSDPILAIFDPDRPIIIYTDASVEGVGAVLKQPQDDGKEKSVFFFSRKLTELQKRKSNFY